ncbi:Hypothetical protein R9X50_00741200 [Acrodontium crateriforme]|uniref:Uncharacterized protein n=1 Tax=Acrodontium crateriforme TaxID=150365 RepID=A0AAQ3MBC0_9PEZI|nr:Hypothetical protein R9X50_00741200 [Acrodontium crateriforme]
MPPTPDDPLQSPQQSTFDPNIQNPRIRPRPGPVNSPLASVATLPYRRSNASLSDLFSSTTSLSAQASDSGSATPTKNVVTEPVFSPAGSATIKSPSSSVSGAPFAASSSFSEVRDLILRAFAPHVSVIASPDTEELVRHKGVNGGLLELLRPFGEHVQGKVTIRDSVGVGRSWDNYGVRFIGPKDGLESPRPNERPSTSSSVREDENIATLTEYKPARLRSGGDVPQIEELVERHLTFAEEQSGPLEAADYINHKDVPGINPHSPSPFYMHYLRRLLSGMPMVPSETISHPVASIIAISSRSQSPIEELRNLFASSNGGEHRLPQWVHNEFLRYYVLIHDEDYDDITKSMTLFDQMKRHFGLHCHLLRLRSTQCVSSDDGSIKLPRCEWYSAAEELSEITNREVNEDEDPTPYIYESDATAIRALVREMVTQSIIPSMERASATWNDQIASRRRGLSGRFMSLSKRFTAFGGRNSSVPALTGGSSNYDSLQGFYRPDAPEALMRKLVDFAMMLRDFKLAQNTCDILCQDFKTDKAWRYYAAANEVQALSTLLVSNNISNKSRAETIDQALDAAYYSYITRVGAPYCALRTLVLGIELLMSHGGSALDDAARWCTRILDDRLVGPVGHVLIMERIAACCRDRARGDRARKAAFWNFLAADAWLGMDKASQAEKCLIEATRLYDLISLDHSQPHSNGHDEDAQFSSHKINAGENGGLRFDSMTRYLTSLKHGIIANRSGPHHLDGADLLAAGDGTTDELTPVLEPLQLEADQLSAAVRSPIGKAHAHRKSLSTANAPVLHSLNHPPMMQALDPLGVSALPTLSSSDSTASGLSPVTERREIRDDGFE